MSWKFCIYGHGCVRNGQQSQTSATSMSKYANINRNCVYWGMAISGRKYRNTCYLLYCFQNRFPIYAFIIVDICVRKSPCPNIHNLRHVFSYLEMEIADMWALAFYFGKFEVQVCKIVKNNSICVNLYIILLKGQLLWDGHLSIISIGNGDYHLSQSAKGR